MSANSFSKASLTPRDKVFLASMIIWIAVIAASFFWNWVHIEKTVFDLARTEALASFNKDLQFRRWATKHGGVYVPPTEETPPNPFLNHLPDRDVITSNNKKLTLLNPAYLIRQIHELSAEEDAIRSHITSLRPLRPENFPDEWEKEALMAFESGLEEYNSLEDMNGQPYFRFMKPIFTENGCLKCHSAQGYKEGDLRGGISVSIPFSTYEKAMRDYQLSFLFWHLLIGFLGLAGLWVGQKKLSSYEKELVEAKLAAQAGKKAMSQFLANMSHEIRTPMNGIIGFMQLLEFTELTGEQKEYFRYMKTSSDSLLTVINDILDISKIESGKLKLEKTHFNLRSTLEAAVYAFAAKGKEKGLELKLLVDQDVPQEVIGDPTRLKQVLTNLVNNAIKFTAQGEIVVEASLKNQMKTQTENTVQLQFKVTDTGIGISPEDYKNIFQPFIQANGTLTSKYGGTGLGLSISKNLVEMMQGELNVESEPGQGSTFTFSIIVQKIF